MKTGKAVSEPMKRAIDQHNAFNLRIKLLFGSLNKVMDDGLKDDVTVALPYGEEPWGEPKTWSSAADGHAAVLLLAELGIVRAASAFEDYLQGVVAELDRAQIPAPAATQSDLIGRVLQRSSMAEASRPPLALVRLFDCARNCIVHQMGRANTELVTLGASEELQDMLVSSSRRKKAKWKPEIPSISLGGSVEWRPRHAIMASDAYYRAASLIDSNLVEFLGEARLVAMAAHWAVVDQLPSLTVRGSLIATIRSALHDRYSMRVEAEDIAPLLKAINRWDHFRSIFNSKYPDRAA